MEAQTTQAALIEAIVLNVFSNDQHLSGYGPTDRRIHMEELRDGLKDFIGDYIGRNGGVHGD